MSRKRRIIILIFISFYGCTLFSCRNVRIKNQKDWVKYFNAYPDIKDAAFEVYDNNKEIASYYNQKRCNTRLIPGSVFDLFNALAALSSNVALDDKFKIKVPNRATGGIDTMTLTQAYREANPDYFHELSKIIGRKQMQNYLDTTQFGNRFIGKNLANFYADGALLVTPDEMVGFIKRFYHGELNAFDQRSIRLVQDMTLKSSEKNNKLYYRTATVLLKSDTVMHWMVGYVEHTEDLKNPQTKVTEPIPHPYFFALNYITTGQRQNWDKISQQITSEILEELHVNE